METQRICSLHSLIPTLCFSFFLKLKYVRYVLLINYVEKDGSNFLVSLMKHLCATIHMKVIEQNFHAVLFIMLCKVVLTFKSVDKIP